MTTCPFCGRPQEENHQCESLGKDSVLIDLDDAASIELDFSSVEQDDRREHEAEVLSEPPVRRRPDEQDVNEEEDRVAFKSIVNRAWNAAGDFRETYWSALVVVVVTLVLLGLFVRLVYFSWFSDSNEVVRITGFVVLSFLEASITISLFLGLTSTCVEVLEGFSVRSSSTFGFILHGPLALITGLICLAVVALGFVLLLVPGVYLGAILAFASFLVLERNLYPLRAIRTSAALTHRHWKTVIPLIWLSAFVICGGFVPFVLVRIFFDLNQWWVYFLVIPIFWTLPFGFFLFGESYRRIAAEGV